MRFNNYVQFMRGIVNDDIWGERIYKRNDTQDCNWQGPTKSHLYLIYRIITTGSRLKGCLTVSDSGVRKGWPKLDETCLSPCLSGSSMWNKGGVHKPRKGDLYVEGSKVSGKFLPSLGKKEDTKVSLSLLLTFVSNSQLIHNPS